jgi:hypothetical protein
MWTRSSRASQKTSFAEGFTHSGALARITHVETLAARALPKSGGIYDLGMELNSDIPHISGFAKFSIAFTQTPEGTGKRTWPFQYSAESLWPHVLGG